MPELRADSIDHLDFPTPCFTCWKHGTRTRAVYHLVFHSGCCDSMLCDRCRAAIVYQLEALVMRCGMCPCPKCMALLPSVADLLVVERIPGV